MNKVELLMKQYFLIKKEAEALKEKRCLLHDDFACCEYGNCIFDGTDEEDFCDFCKGLNDITKEIRELGYKRTSIILKVRSIVLTNKTKNHEQNRCS